MVMSDKSEYKFRKLVKRLEAIKGRHTELVTVYVPAGYSLHDITGQLRSEQGTAENIKSKSVRKNVVAALEKIMRHLQLYKKPPEHGLAIFCGNTSEKEGAADIELIVVEPPEPLKNKLYWCDQKFVLDPLLEMIKEKEIYGIINLDKSEGDIAILHGKKIMPMVHLESIVPGKTRAGGQSAMRFARVREGMLNDWLKEMADAANKVFEERKDVLGIIISGPGPIKEFFVKEEYLHGNVRDRIIGIIDTSYTGEHGLHETLARAEDLLKEAAVTREKQILQKFFTELQKPHGLVAYGRTEVDRVLELGAVETILISDGLEQEEEGIIERYEEKSSNYGSKVEVVSADTREGQQFLALGGIGALLRYHAG
jgi:peptide chain release factor subunit 1